MIKKRNLRKIPEVIETDRLLFSNRQAVQHRLLNGLFVLILAFSIGYKIYRADQAGITFDESRTFRSYATSVSKALTSYSRPNNHVLNSIFVHYAHKFFSSYDHFIRLPSLFAGICYSLALAYIIKKTILLKSLQVASLALISFVPFVFDFSFLARGYAFALAAIFIQVAYIVWSLEHKLRFRYWWLPVLVVSLMNFLALGAMLSSVIILLAFNMIFTLLYAPNLFHNSPRRLISILVQLVPIALVSLGALFLLYMHLYDQIIHSISTQSTKGDPYFTYLGHLLIDKVLPYRTGLGKIIFVILIALVILALSAGIYRIRVNMRATRAKRINLDSPQNLIYVYTLVTLVILFVYNVVLDYPLGYLRNQIFLIPLVLLAIIVLFDQFILNFHSARYKKIFHVIIMLTVLWTAGRNFPLRPVLGSASLTKPLLQKLRAIDPEKIWHIAYSKKKWNLSLALQYYAEETDYKCRWTRMNECHIYICDIRERPKGAVFLDWDFFSKKYNCAVVIRFPILHDEMVLEAKPIDENLRSKK